MSRPEAGGPEDDDHDHCRIQTQTPPAPDRVHHARHDHAGTGHDHRQRGAALHAGLAVGDRRPDQLGADLLYRGRRHRDAGHPRPRAPPVPGFLGAGLGRKRLFLIAVAGFTADSVLCGIAISLPEMVAFRLIQGLFGASLVPLSQAVLLDSYPKEKHGSAMAMWGMGVMVGPILGPTLGGWLTEAYNWRWVFYINVPIGILTFAGLSAYLSETKTRKTGFDWFGFAMLSIAIGSFQMMLDRGEQLDWFSSTEIWIEAVLAALAFYLFLVQTFTVKRPFID